MTKQQLTALENTRKSCERKYGLHRDQLRRVHFQYRGLAVDGNMVLRPHESLLDRFSGSHRQITHIRAEEL